ncbi:MAG: hypothetical protein ABSC93_25785 [Bryobacteraceae bacterium]
MGTTAVNLSYHGSAPVRTVDSGNGAQVVPQAKLAGAGGIFGRRNTAQLKDIFDFAKRAQILKDAFSVDSHETKGKRILLIDDLFRSGATVSAIAHLLSTTGGALALYLRTLTQTRKLA